jgi:misacylated tRNA(Ala) deacylase
VTELLYLATSDAAYERSFTATVRALPPGGVVLDRTLFYPVGGGQPADRGELRSYANPEGPVAFVADVARVGESVLHRLGRPRGGGARPSFALGETVEGRIDWSRRYRHMRLHTAQHLVSARAFARTHLRTRRALLSGTEATVDLEAAWPGELTLDEFADDLRERTRAAAPVRVRFLPRAEWDRAPVAERSGLVPLPPAVDPVRLIEIAETDLCPCGGTHLRSTGEIGALVLEPLATTETGDARLRFRLEEPDRPEPPTRDG